MEKSFNTIRYRELTYQFQPLTSYYLQNPAIVPFDKLPKELKVEESQQDYLKKQGAEQVIRGRVRNGQYLYFSGLVPVQNSNLNFFGNHCENRRDKKVLSLVIFRFTEDFSTLKIYFFNNFYKANRAERIAFCADFLRSIN